MNIRQSAQSGFTLIELVVVIVILGILAATAMPKFVDMKADAQKGVANGIAGALASAMAMNYAKKQIGSGTTANKCTDIVLTDFVQGQPSGWSVVTAAATVANGVTFTCTVTDGTASATFMAVGAV